MSKAAEYFEEMVECNQLDYQDEEPYSKNLLRAENKELKENNARFLKKCERWLELLKTDGINSKSMVANDIQHLLKEMKQDEKD